MLNVSRICDYSVFAATSFKRPNRSSGEGATTFKIIGSEISSDSGCCLTAICAASSLYSAFGGLLVHHILKRVTSGHMVTLTVGALDRLLMCNTVVYGVTINVDVREHDGSTSPTL